MRRVRRKAIQANLALALALTLTLTAAAGLPVLAAGEITGAGSTWVYPLVAQWSAAYATQTGIQVNYQSIGSGGGIQQIKAGTVAFGASDMPLTPAALRQNNLIQFPTAIAGEDIVYNLPGIAPGRLVFSGPVIADIYLGRIKSWNDPAIARLNPGVALPDMRIIVIHRSDGSGTTFTFADYLSKVSAQWKQQVGASTAISWPTGFGAKGNEGVASYVERIRGAIGYVEYAFILETHLAYARMINRSGEIVSPSLQAFQAAAANVNFSKIPDFYVILTNQPGAGSWPLSGCTWQILRTRAPKSINEAVTRFFLWAFERGQAMAESIGFGPLPASAVRAIRAYWKRNLGI